MNPDFSYDYIVAGNIKAEDIKEKFDLKDYFNFCKIYAREHKSKDSRTKISEEIEPKEFFTKFTFVDRRFNLKDRQYKNCRVAEFPFLWLKKAKFKKPEKELDVTSESLLAENYAGILKDVQDVQEYTRKLLPGSFVITADIKLKSPYFSQDDDNFVIVDNPVLKEHVFKVPMIRGSSWKGALASAAKKLVREDLKCFPQFARIWGLGSSEYRDLIDSLKENHRKKAIDAAISFALFELGLNLDKKYIDIIKDNPLNFLKQLSEDLTDFLQPHKGRAVFYPTFFNKISYEVINPHDRKKRAGINPINYEIVPEGSQGKLQIIYIPYDAVLSKSEVLKEQVEKDLSFLCKVIEMTEEKGIGAKTKLGWGRFELSDQTYCITHKDLAVKGWNQCWI